MRLSKELLRCIYPPPLSQHQASGDIRPNGDRYIYYIQLSGITNNSMPTCLGANICQDKLNGKYKRRIGSSSKAKYYIKGDLMLREIRDWWCEKSFYCLSPRL